MISADTFAQNQRTLIVEDEPLLTLLLEEMLQEIGCQVAGTASSFDEAMEKVKTLEFDVAVVDLNLNGRQSDPILQTLIGRGRPFVISTGYGIHSLPLTLRDKPILHKPFQASALQAALRAALTCRPQDNNSGGE